MTCYDLKNVSNNFQVKNREFSGLCLKKVTYIFDVILEIVTYIFEVAYPRKCKLQLAEAPPQ